MRRGSDSATANAGTRPSGLAGLSASEVSLRGTLRSREGFVGMVEGADKKTYLVRTGDRLRDGTVRSVGADTVVILQQVDDPLSRETERVVQKTLRETEEAR
jgi:Tfp pilus assembly protein PilP